jgi:hypothetical protein
VKTLVFITLTFLLYYILSSWTKTEPNLNYEVDYSIKWPSFIKDCGKSVYYETAKQRYQKNYMNKYVQWEGHVMRVDGNEMNYLHQARILMVMDPRDTHT